MAGCSGAITNRPRFANESNACRSLVISLVSAFGSPDVEHQLVPTQRHAGVDAVAGGVDVAATGHPVPERVAGRFNYLLVGAGIEQSAVDVANETDAIADAALQIG